METHIASNEDISAMVALHAESFGAEAWSVEQISGSLSSETTRTFIAKDGDNALGFISCQLAADEAEILTFCVAETARRKGVGAELLKVAISFAKTQGAKKIFLEVASDNNAAQALYKNAGFAAIGKRHGYYKRDGSNVDAIMLSLNPTEIKQ